MRPPFHRLPEAAGPALSVLILATLTAGVVIARREPPLGYWGEGGAPVAVALVDRSEKLVRLRLDGRRTGVLASFSNDTDCCWPAGQLSVADSGDAAVVQRTTFADECAFPFELVPVRGGPRSTLACSPRGQAQQTPRVSEDGRWLAFGRSPGDGTSVLVLTRIGSGSEHVVPLRGVELTGLAWWPDADGLAVGLRPAGRSGPGTVVLLPRTARSLDAAETVFTAIPGASPELAGRLADGRMLVCQAGFANAVTAAGAATVLFVARSGCGDMDVSADGRYALFTGVGAPDRRRVYVWRLGDRSPVRTSLRVAAISW